MNKKKMTILAVSSALLIVAALFGSLFLSGRQGQEPIVVPLPPSAPPVEDILSLEPVKPTPTPIIVSSENVQAVIETLSRPVSYSAEVVTQLFWRGGLSETRRRLWKRGDTLRIDVLNAAGSATEYRVLTPLKTYIWLPGSGQAYAGEPGEFSSDAGGRIPTYEDLLALDPDLIEDAAYLQWEDSPAIVVRTAPDDLGQVYVYWIALDSGLLVAARTEQDGEITYAMSLENLSLAAPEDEVFRLPNGALPWEV